MWSRAPDAQSGASPYHLITRFHYNLIIPGLRADTCCAVLHGSLLIVWYIQLQSCKCIYNKLTYLLT